ncbi:HlyD family efflux transporter periplasmic adaptor subunit [Aeoliella sp. ICT_H6.2]|uniref:HlyD family efflux transporter periplasmic adaptor subunit n=1 Tax=Aeoliella straminimaris TaxID=2954799 RepID=A0A9X2F5T0_9BACT|nr:HlyD family efflux transporter periplasmic adaptor subunit [Aeoliella straminimaris]MCO6042720.1 HlyD family efflux transporter periplasmic adaptor subunit [Aeoliella straminimaris]
MSDSSSQLDLSQLAVDRSGPTKKTAIQVRRSWFTKYVLPLGILVGFLSLFGWAARDSFLPAQSITITPVVVSRAEVKQEGTPLFQAAGWIEPRPTPVMASALAAGVIEELLVIEGQHVKQGEPVARLIDADARLALAEARAAHALQVAEVNRAEATLVAAKTNFDQPTELQATLAEAGARLNETEVAISNLPYAIETARARLQLATENVRRKELAGQAISGRALREARADLAAAKNTLAELVAREPKLEAQAKSLREKRDALDAQLRLLTNETRAVAEAKANLAAAQAKLDQTRLRVEAMELQLERMIVRSPIEGCVLSLDARPGQWLSGVGSSSSQGSTAVVGLYDPESLQIRVDVRLEDVPQVQIGQPAQIETAALAAPIEGEVISVTTFADIQKNTLQVKVAISAPPAVIKPEMLGKVTFLAPRSPVVKEEPGDSPLKLFVPQTLVSRGEGSASVWVVDLTAGIAKQKAVEVGRGATESGLVEITNGLQPTDKLIVSGRESVVEGTRVRVSGEDRTLMGGGWNRGTTSPETRTAQANP